MKIIETQYQTQYTNIFFLHEKCTTLVLILLKISVLVKLEIFYGLKLLKRLNWQQLLTLMNSYW